MRKRLQGVIERAQQTSPCGDYTYQLARSWGPGSTLRWVLLHPGPELSHEDSPDTRACIRHSMRLGFGACRIAYLYPLRCNRGELWLEEESDQLGIHVLSPRHSDFLVEFMTGPGKVVAAWGVVAPRLRVEYAAECSVCNGSTLVRLDRGGSPKHPPTPIDGGGDLVAYNLGRA